MTICMAALCDDGKALVVSTDKMITASHLMLEFEHPDAKIDPLNDVCVGLSAGDAMAAAELFKQSSGDIQKIKKPTIQGVVDIVTDRFALLRRQAAEDHVLKPRGMGLADFYQGLINRMPQELGLMIDSQIHQFKLGAQVIIAGIDASGAHIHNVGDPGVSTCFDRLGYYAIGSGETHALLNIIGSNHHKTNDINKTVYSVYEAKKRAELAQGVGKETVIEIINKDGIREISLEEQELLATIYNQKIAPQQAEIDAAINDLPFK